MFKIKYDFIFYCVNYGQPKKWMANQKSTVLINTQSLCYFLENCITLTQNFYILVQLMFMIRQNLEVRSMKLIQVIYL